MSAVSQRKPISAVLLLLSLVFLSVLTTCAKGELLVVSDVAPNIEVEILSDTQVKLTNHNLAVGYAVDVYKDGVFQPSYSLSENDLLGLGLFGGFFGTKTKVITLPDALTLTRFRLEMYAKILPEGHPRREFSRKVALKNMDAAFTGMITNILNFVGVVAEAPKIAKFASDIVRAGGASDRFLDGDLAGGFNKLATWAASEVGKAGILIAAQEAGISISAGTASLIGGMVAVAFTLPTVWDVIVSDPQLYHSITLELRTNEISPSYGIITNGRCTDPDGWCYKDTIPTFDIGDALWFSATVFNRSTVPLFNVSLEASLYGPDDSLVEHSAGGGFNLVWNYEPYYPKYFDLAPYPDPGYYAPVGLKPDYPLTVSSTGHQYRGGLYRLETQLLGWYGSDTLGSSANYIKVLDGQVPGAPQLVTGEVVGDNIVVSWRPPPNTYDISYYIVRRFPNANRTGDIRVFTVEVPERKTPSEKLAKVAPYLLDEFIEPSVSYYYEVKIVDWDDLESEWSPLCGPVCVGEGDSYEPDDTYSEANWIDAGSSQVHSIVPVGDVDWVKFQLGTRSEVVIETCGVTGDTRMWLYNSTLNQIECNDDGGSGLFSRIDRLCETDALAAGTYYVKVDEYENNDQILNYSINLTIIPCGSGNHYPRLSNGSVQPLSGDTNTDFYWYVDYYDEDGDVPPVTEVRIDSQVYGMSHYKGSFSNGTYICGPVRLAEGAHGYYFYFIDGKGGEASLPSSGQNTGPFVNTSTGQPDLILTDDIPPTNDRFLAFDSTPPGSAKTATVTLTNQGAGALTVQGIPEPPQPAIWVGDGGDGGKTAYSLTFPDDPDGDGAFVLEPGGSQRVRVVFSPIELRRYRAWLKINSNDPDYPTGCFVTLDGAGLPPSLSDIVMVGAEYDHAGMSVGSAGDVNGDGYDDVLIGASSANIGPTQNAGRAYLVYGGPNLSTPISLPSHAGFLMEGINSSHQLGNCVSSGDFNRDGYSDLAIGAYNNQGGLRAYLMYGRSDLSGTISADGADLVVKSTSTSQHTRSISLADDLNGDVYDDLIVGGDNQVWIVMGSTNLRGILNLPADPNVVTVINGVNGDALAHAGDVDGDGLGDMVIAGQNREVQLFLGRLNWSTGLDRTDADCRFQAVDVDYYIRSVAGLGDINGDGYDDIIIGAQVAGGNAPGRAHVFYGRGTWPSILTMSDANVTLIGAGVQDNFGFVVRGASDFSTDGYDDILLGAPRSNINGTGSGEVYLVCGRSNLPTTITMPSGADLHQTGAQGSSLGMSCGFAGDTDRDGHSDIVLGAPFAATGRGEVYLVYSGRPAPVVPARPKPDLCITGIEGDTLVAPGEQFDVNVSVENIGPGPAHSYTIACYLSADQVLEESSDMLLGNICMRRLGIGETDVGEMSPNLSTLSDGFYYVIAKVDAMNESTEVNELNNIAVKPMSVRGKPPRVLSCSVGGTSGQRSSIDKLAILFDSWVGVEPNDVTITNLDSGEPIPFVLEYSYHLLTLYLKQPLFEGEYEVRLFAKGIADSVGNLLDGNGDGTGGDDYIFDFSCLFGDSDGNGSVDCADLDLFTSKWLYTICDTDNDWCNGTDLKRDGRVDWSDFAVFAANWLEGTTP
jgi:hypothetical protein